MTRTPVRSSNIAAIGYDAVTGILEIEFKNGDVYQYDNVAEATHKALMKANSIGSYVAIHIKNKYSHRKVN